MGKAQYWLFKSEPGTYSIADLRRDKRTTWDGVRNPQARNFIRQMKAGDLALFYHSSCDPPAVAGIAKVCREAYPDHSAWTKGDPHFDPKSSKADPKWLMVDIEFVEDFPAPIALESLRNMKELQGMRLLQQSRLSVQPVEETHFQIIRKLGGKHS